MHFDRELRDALKQGCLIGAAIAALAIPPRLEWRAAAQPVTAPTQLASSVERPLNRRLDFAGEPASLDAQQLAGWVVDAADNGSRPFAIVDKRHAKVFVFEPDGRLHAATPVLLGYAAGDDTVPGIGKRPIDQVRPEERTTPAGRFVSEPGRNALDEEVVWVDYEAAVSMHRVRVTNPAERRLERLDTPTEADNRISFGCINMPVAFFEEVLWPRFKTRGAIVYVLPETRPLREVFAALREAAARAALPRAIATNSRGSHTGPLR
jgi:hypothetical protein